MASRTPSNNRRKRRRANAGADGRDRQRLSYLNGLNDCGPVSFGSRGVSISSRRSLSRRMKANPNRGSASICQPSPASCSIATAIALGRSAAGSTR